MTGMINTCYPSQGRHKVITLPVLNVKVFTSWQSISPILFEVGIPIFVCKCMFVPRIIAYPFWVTATLT